MKDWFWATHGGMGGVPWHARNGLKGAYVNEGLDELALTHATYDLAGIRWVPRPGERRTQKQFLHDRYEWGVNTHVTYEQDMEGARDVWRWAEHGLHAMGFLP